METRKLWKKILWSFDLKGWFGKIYSVETSTVSFDVEEKKLEKMKYELLNSECVTHWDYVEKEAA